MVSKSVLLFGSLILIALPLYIRSSKVSMYIYKVMEIMNDLPIKRDLDKYLTALERVVSFIENHRHFVDFNVCFGIYLINVNLRSFMLHPGGHTLDIDYQVRFNRVMKTNDITIAYFTNMTLRHMLEVNPAGLSSQGLMNVYTFRPRPNSVKRFNIEMLKKTKFYSRKMLQKIYFKWTRYLKSVVASQNHPSVKQLDYCVMMLLDNPLLDIEVQHHCFVPFNCVTLVLDGRNYGYGITRRIIYLLAAQYFRGCYVMPTADDKKIIQKLCLKIFNEIEFIVNHDYAIPDLVMEQISLCTIEGHTQFLRRSWIADLMDFQTVCGCFNMTRTTDGPCILSDKEEKWSFIRQSQATWDGVCHPHATAMAGPMLAAVIRFIAENYY